MRDWDTTDYVTAFAVGTVIGIGAALIFRPKKTRTQRIMKEIEPYRKQASKSARRASKRLGREWDAATDRGEALVDTGRDVLERFRDELVDMASSATSELDAMISERLGEAQKSLRKTAKKVRS